MMRAAVGGGACVATGEQLSEYENANGTGQVHVWFDRPALGWAGRGDDVAGVADDEPASRERVEAQS